MATYDLRTGIAHKPDPLDYITKQTGCRSAPIGTPHPLWTAFLDRVTNHNKDLQAFLQRWCGYCCTGETTEHVFVFVYGTGANGKGTFINTIADVLGDYATTAHVGTFLASRNEHHPTDVAKLRGARLVIAQETEKGRRWDETKIKTLTGGDKVTARFMRQDFFDFDPKFKLMISGNHKPQLNNVDEAIRRRLLIIPFTVQIPLAERDPQLRNKLRAEWPAILRWMIDGCLQWQKRGLAPPDIVRTTTAEYFTDQDTIGEWLEECTEFDRSAFARTLELFASWKTWADNRQFRVGSVKSLSESLDAHNGLKKGKNDARQAGFYGLTIKG
jgi:putative DNA primase/helicase